MRDKILDRVVSLHPAVRANRAALAALEFRLVIESHDPAEWRRAMYGDTSPLPAIIRGRTP